MFAGITDRNKYFQIKIADTLLWECLFSEYVLLCFLFCEILFLFHQFFYLLLICAFCLGYLFLCFLIHLHVPCVSIAHMNFCKQECMHIWKLLCICSISNACDFIYFIVIMFVTILSLHYKSIVNNLR